MVQRNFILTDVMKTGNHVELENFIKFADLEGHSFHTVDQWYELYQHDMTEYHKRIALLDMSKYSLRLFEENISYRNEVFDRLEWLKRHDFNIIICNIWESKKWSQQHVKDLPGNAIWSSDLSFFWYRMYNRYKNHKFKFYHVQKHFDFLYLNKTTRTHRNLLFDKLQSKNLLSNSLYSYHDKGITLNADYEIPAFRNKKYPQYGHDRDIYEPQFNHSKFNLVSETTHDELFFTEKIWKPIIAGQIFIVHGKHLYLKGLQSLGFKTYDGYIDESYDTIESLEQRTDAIVDLCEKLKGQPHIRLYHETREIREHNQKVFFSEHHCRSACRKTINDLFELVDGSEISS